MFLAYNHIETENHGNELFLISSYDFVNSQIVLFDVPKWLLIGKIYTTGMLLNYFLEEIWCTII